MKDKLQIMTQTREKSNKINKKKKPRKINHFQ